MNRAYLTYSRAVIDKANKQGGNGKDLRAKIVGEGGNLGFTQLGRVEAARERGIVVCNIPAYSTDSVAQHVFALLLNATTHVDHYAEAVRRGEWSKQQDFCY